jgi:hypothetical protein
MRHLRLCFDGGELIEVGFKDSAVGVERHTIRGKTGGAYRQAGSFQWTSAVRALALLAVKAVSVPEHPAIQGDGGSLASSLDYALSKQPEWLTESFGCDSGGITYARRFILRTNPNRKRPGPVVLALNVAYLPTSSIEIRVNGKPASAQHLTALHKSLSGEGPYSEPTAIDVEDLYRLAS